MILRIPPGYSHFREGVASVVAQDALVPALRAALVDSDGKPRTLYAFAAQHPEQRLMQGRRPAYAVPFPGVEGRVVVRRSHHGGVLAPLTRDLFLMPTRAPYELFASLVLGRAGIPTPPVVAYAIYRAGPLLRRSDVLTRELPGQDLGAALSGAGSEGERRHLLAPIADLIRALTRAGAWHPDLNVKNVLLADVEGVMRAFVLDVDRIRFHPPGDPMIRDANLARLERSARKWRTMFGSGFDESELRSLRELASGT